MAKTAYERNKNAIKKYLTDKTDSIQIRVSKGKKEEYRAFAEKRGTSLNALICRMLDAEMRNNTINYKIINEFKFTKANLDITVIIRECPTNNDVACKILYYDNKQKIHHNEIPEMVINEKTLQTEKDIKAMALKLISDSNMSVLNSLNNEQ